MVYKSDNDLKNAYFKYLVSRMCDRDHKKADYLPLFELLHSMKFVVVIDMDVNRAGDGTYLRKRWLQKEDLYDYLYVFDDEKASILEVLVGISERLEFEMGNVMRGDHTSDRFWEILRNLDIEKYTSDRFEPLEIKEKLRIWMNRKFDKLGNGSIFPLKSSENDQRKVEIWVQMNEYIIEKCGW